MNRLDVLDEGYVILHDVLGSDHTVANAARVSYDKRTEELTEPDIRLINFLAREGHTSPFRHTMLQFEVYAPLLVARQHWKYVVGSDHTMDAWNESSRRYVSEEPVFYVPKPHEWRSAPRKRKQGSGPTLDPKVGDIYTNSLLEHIDTSIALYEEAMANGVSAEQARLFLPAYGMYVRYYWTASMQSVAHFIQQRLQEDAQKEIQEYAKVVYILAKQAFPNAMTALIRG